jgi:hypothetical protein
LGRISNPARGIVEAMYSVCSRLIASSWSLSTTKTDAVMVLSCASVQFGWLAHILPDLRGKSLVLLRRRRVRLVLMAGALNKGDEGWVLLHAILNTRSHRVGSKGKDLANPVRMSHPSR